MGDEMLTWSEDLGRSLAASDGATLTTSALDTDADRIDLLERRGYQKTERYSARMSRSLDKTLPEPTPPDDMRLRHATNADIEERVATHRCAWSVWGESKVTVDSYRRLRNAPGYDEELDIVLETADGTFASYCVCWLDTTNGVGLFEPVGTGPEFTGRGCAQAVIVEGLRRLRDRGMHTAIVQTASINERALTYHFKKGQMRTGAC